MSRTQQLADQAQGPLGAALVVVAVAALAGIWWAVATLGGFLLLSAVMVDLREPAGDVDDGELGEGGY